MLYDRYYYLKLNSREKKAYKKIYSAMQNHQPTVTINGFCEEDIPKLMSAINLDNPHLFFVDFHYELQFDLFSQTIILKYLYNKADTAALTEKIKKVCDKILSNVQGQAEFEKELSLHDILVQNVLYDKMARNNIPKFRTRSNTILGVLFYKTAVCEGIAKTFKFLLNALDIKCIVIKGKALDCLTGRASDTLHAWNMVKIDGEPYYVDLTWDINLSQNNTIRHDYLNLTERDISIDHIIDPNFPKCIDNHANYYYKNGLVVRQKSDLLRIFTNEINVGKSTVEVKIIDESIKNPEHLLGHVISMLNYPKLRGICCTKKSMQNTCCFSWSVDKQENPSPLKW